jgi:hypothetical protein
MAVMGSMRVGKSTTRSNWEIGRQLLQTTAHLAEEKDEEARGPRQEFAGYGAVGNSLPRQLRPTP